MSAIKLRTTPIDKFDATGALSREFLLEKKKCCDNGCKNCPYKAINEYQVLRYDRSSGEELK